MIEWAKAYLGVFLNNMIDFVYNKIVNLDLHCLRPAPPIAHEKLTCVEAGLYNERFFSVVLVVKQISLIMQQVALLGGAGNHTTLARAACPTCNGLAASTR